MPPAALPGLVFIRSLSNAGKLHQALASAEVRILVSLGLGREGTIGGPKVDQRLHGLELMRLEHVEGRGGQDEVAEAAVEGLLEVEVVERLGEVSPVEVRVDAEHLAEDSLTDVDKILRET